MEREKARAEENATNTCRMHTAQMLSVEDEKENLRRTVHQLRAQVGSVLIKLGRKKMEPSRVFPLLFPT